MRLNRPAIPSARGARAPTGNLPLLCLPSKFPLQRMKFIILDSSRKCALNRNHQSHIGLKAVSQFEPKRERADPGGLFPFSALGLDSETEGERFAMQLFKKFCVLFCRTCC